MTSKKVKKGDAKAMAEQILHEHFSKLGRKGGKARFVGMSQEDRRKLASKAAKARWTAERTRRSEERER
jgi:hypothetical protein